MIEDPTLTQYCLEPIEANNISSAEPGEVAYGLTYINHGTFAAETLAKKHLEEIIHVADDTLGFEIYTECDLYPCTLETYRGDKTKNAEYNWGDHAPGEKYFQEQCVFAAGDKVLCLIHEGYDAVFPAIVVGPLTEEYLQKLYEEDEVCQIHYSSADELVADWNDWDWDSVIVKPLVKLKNDWDGAMGDTIIVNRVYVFPYKKFKI